MAKLTEKISSLKAKLQMLEAEQKAQERAARQAERTKSRKAESRRKYELGGLIKLAGLFDADKGAILGALLALAPAFSDEARFAEFKRAGDALLERREQERLSKAGEPTDPSYLQ